MNLQDPHPASWLAPPLVGSAGAELLALVQEADWIHGATVVVAIFTLGSGYIIGMWKAKKLAELEVEDKRLRLEIERRKMGGGG